MTALDQRESALMAQVARLTALHEANPVAVNLQSGGNVAYATFVTGGRLYGYSLATTEEYTALEWNLPATHLGVNGSVVPVWEAYAVSHDPDALPLGGDACLLTYWDTDNADALNEYTDGTYWVHNTATGITTIYGIGEVIA